MRVYQSPRFVAVLALLLFAALFRHTALAGEIKDGQSYRAEEAVGFGGALMVFRKQGTEVVGISFTGEWHACYHGSLDGSRIKVKGAVLQHKDPVTKEFSYEPILKSLRHRFVEISFVNVKPFPNPGALIPTPRPIVERDTLSLNECARYFGELPDQVSPSPGQQECSSQYYVAFIARRGVPGHAFVQWIEVDAEQKMTRSEAFGLYPREDSSKEALLGAVPGALKNEYLQTEGVTGDVVLRLEVTAEEFNETVRIRDQWSQRLSGGGLTYEIIGRNCIDFAVEVIRALHGLRPSIRPPTSDTPSDISDLIGAPYRYISHIYRLNQADHVTATGLEAVCP